LNFRKFSLFALALIGLLLLPNAAFAHSALVSAVPSDKQAAVEEVKEVVLTFNTPIEPVSKLEVLNDADNALVLQETNTNGKKMTGILKQPLTSGKYTVNWRIIGEDGHAIKGSYAFEVDIPESEPSESQTPIGSIEPPETPQSQISAEPDPTAQQQASPEPSVTPSAQPLEDSEKPTAANMGSLVSKIVLIAAAILLVIAIIFVLFKKKKQ